MDEQMIKDVVKKMFASGELLIGMNITESEGNQLRYSVYVTDNNDEILQSSSIFIEQP